jgi:hypothetical protein
VKYLGPLFLAAMLLGACAGPKEMHDAASVLVGTVIVIGNEPFTQLSIQSDDHRTHIIRKDTTEMYRSMWKMQGQKLRIRFRPVAGASDSTHINLEHFELVKD